MAKAMGRLFTVIQGLRGPKGLWSLGTVGSVLVLGILWSWIHARKVHALAATSSAPMVFLTQIKPSPISSTIEYPAMIESQVNASVRALGDGVVTKIYKQLGDKVRAGEAIAIMKHYDPVYQYAPLKIISPVAGVVSKLDVTPGTYVGKDSEVASVSEPGNLRAVIQVVSSDLHQIGDGQAGTLTISDQDHPFSTPVRVAGVSGAVDPVVGTAPCDLDFVNGKALGDMVYAGEVGEVQFRVDTHQGILIPQSALAYKGDTTYVRVVARSVSHDRSVTLGKNYGDNVEILSGLKPGDQIIQRASDYVANGQRVVVESAHE